MPERNSAAWGTERNNRIGLGVVSGAWVGVEFYSIFGWVGGVAVAGSITIVWIAERIYIAGRSSAREAAR